MPGVEWWTPFLSLCMESQLRAVPGGGVVDTIGDIWCTACTSTPSYCLFFSYYMKKVSTLHPKAITEDV